MTLNKIHLKINQIWTQIHVGYSTPYEANLNKKQKQRVACIKKEKNAVKSQKAISPPPKKKMQKQIQKAAYSEHLIVIVDYVTIKLACVCIIHWAQETILATRNTQFGQEVALVMQTTHAQRWQYPDRVD